MSCVGRCVSGMSYRTPTAPSKSVAREQQRTSLARIIASAAMIALTVCVTPPNHSQSVSAPSSASSAYRFCQYLPNGV